MKKCTILILIMALTLSCFSGCSSNGQKENPTEITSSEKNEQVSSSSHNDENQQNESKDKNIIEKVNIDDLTALQNNCFTYINAEGHLIIHNIKDGSEQVIISDGFVNDYDLNFKDNKIIYIVRRDTYFLTTDAVIYDFNTKLRDVISSNTQINTIKWSPSRKYIALTEGLGPGCGHVRIYDVKSKTWLKVPSKKGDGFEAMDFKWNPSEDIIALEMVIHPEPPSPVGAGESFSISVYYPEKNNSIKGIANGSSDYGYDKFQWIDNKTLSIRKSIYNKVNGIEYYKANINNGKVVKVPKNESDPLIQKIPEEAYLFDRSLSSDDNLLLYSIKAGLESPGDIYLWNIEKQTKELLCHGWIPKWIVNK